MPRTLIDTTYLTIYDPRSLLPSAWGLEIVFLVCASLTLADALRERERGDSGPLFLWLCAFTYGLTIELVTYNFLDNFAHGRFPVMFYHHKLPLYVSVLYPVYQYTAARSVKGLRLSAWAEALCAGLVIVALDVPYDINGPDAGWWTWDLRDPNISATWLGVPVTSYCWHLLFGGSLVLLARRLAPRFARAGGAGAALYILLVAAGTMVLGFIAFLPFHLFKKLGASDGAIVAWLVVLSGFLLGRGLFRGATRGTLRGPLSLLWLVPLLHYSYQLAVALFLPGGGVKLLVKGLTAGAALFFFALRTWPRRRDSGSLGAATAPACAEAGAPPGPRIPQGAARSP